MNELQFIADNEKLLKDSDIAAKLTKITGENVTGDMVRAQRRKLNIKKRRGRKKQNIEILIAKCVIMLMIIEMMMIK